MNKLLPFLLLCILCNCKKTNTTEVYFTGKSKQVSFDDVVKENIRGIAIDLSDIQTGSLAVHDSLMIYISNKFPEYGMRIYNKKDLSFIGQYCPKGEGPDEFLLIGAPLELFSENGELKTWVYDVAKKDIVLLNIFKSMSSNSTSIESKVEAPWQAYPYNFAYVLNDESRLLKETAINGFNLHNIHYLRMYNSKELYTDTLSIFKIHNIPPEKDTFRDHLVFYSSSDRLRPDNKKVAMGMYYFPQINILDLKSGELIGISPSSDLLDWNYVNRNPEDATRYYQAICTTNEHIYALYLDILEKNIPNEALSNILHIYDWNGNLVRHITTEQPLRDITIDNKTGTLYGVNDKDEVFYFGKVL